MNSVFQEQIIHHIEKKKRTIFELYNENTSFLQSKICTKENSISTESYQA